MILYQECSSHLDLSKNIATRGQGLFSLYIYIENFKNLFVRNQWINFNIILQKCTFGDPLPRLFKPFRFVKKHGCQRWGLFTLYIYIEKIKIFLSETTGPISVLFCRNVSLVILYQDCSSHLDSSKTWPPGGGAYFRYISI